MKITIDSNLWEKIVHPDVFKQPAERHEQLLLVHHAIRDGRLTGFICQSVATMEAIKKVDRTEFLSTQTMRPRVIEPEGSDQKMVIFAPDQSARPPLMPVLVDRMKDAVQMGIRLIRVPVYTELELPSDFYSEEPDDFVEKYGPIQYAMEQRCVGRSQLEQLGHSLAMQHPGNHMFAVGAIPNLPSFTDEEKARIKKAVAEAADGDALCAHIALGNDHFCSEDFGKSAGAQSILDPVNRAWLSDTYNVRFASLAELTAML